MKKLIGGESNCSCATKQFIFQEIGQEKISCTQCTTRIPLSDLPLGEIALNIHN